MNEQLEALKTAMDSGDWDSARDLATAYVTGHPDEFDDYRRIVAEAPDEKTALEKVAASCEALLLAGLHDLYYHAEAFQLHRWQPMDVGGSIQPQVRNELPAPPAPAQQPKVRNHK